jgi:hypothetical protein
VRSVSVSDLVIPAIRSAQQPGSWPAFSAGQPQPVTITATATANSPTAQDMQQWWQNTLQGQSDVRTLGLASAQNQITYEFRDCVPFRSSQQSGGKGSLEVMQMQCNLWDVASSVRQEFFDWLQDTLQGNDPVRRLFIDASYPTGLQLPPRDYQGVVITGYRFPSFEAGDYNTPAADAMRFQPSQRLYP